MGQIGILKCGIPSFEDDPYRYSLVFDDNKFDDKYATDYAAVILVGTTPTGNSTSSSREGGEPAIHHPKNIAKFQLAMEAIDAAHRKGNDRKMDLLASL